MSDCPACGSRDWLVAAFTGGERSAVETRECRGCGHEWTEVLQR